MKAFVTGGTGFVGAEVIRRLLARGYDVTAVVRSSDDARRMEALGVEPVIGDIRVADSLREGMDGSDVVFHVAGWYKIGGDPRKAYEVNVMGTRIVLGLAYELDIPLAVYTSTLAVHGDTRGVIVDERYPIPTGELLTEYDRTKYEAHQEALRLVKQGAPIIILMPGVVYGPNDHSLSGDLLRYFFLGQLPLLPAPNTKLTWVHLEDIAEAHIIAAEKGLPGETYITTGPIVSFGEMVKIWAELSGRPRPFANIPARFLRPFAPILEVVEKVKRLPPVLSSDGARIAGATYLGTSDKAREQLGWEAQPVREGMADTIHWMEHNVRAPRPISPGKRRAAAIALGAGVGVLIAWLLRRRSR